MITIEDLTDEQVKIYCGVICPYCKGRSKIIESKEIYGRDYGFLHICKPCNAYVGCHRNSVQPLGRLAKKELRKLKKEAHLYFDKIWKLKCLTRTEAYAWLSKQLRTPPAYTHIGMFSEETCKEVIEISKLALNANRRLDMDFGVKPVTEYFK